MTCAVGKNVMYICCKTYLLS